MNQLRESVEGVQRSSYNMSTSAARALGQQEVKDSVWFLPIRIQIRCAVIVISFLVSWPFTKLSIDFEILFSRNWVLITCSIPRSLMIHLLSSKAATTSRLHPLHTWGHTPSSSSSRRPPVMPCSGPYGVWGPSTSTHPWMKEGVWQGVETIPWWAAQWTLYRYIKWVNFCYNETQSGSI